MKVNSSTNVKGLTLVEILVSVAIGALLLGGILQVFNSLGTTNRLAGSLSDMQESARIALNIITRDTRLVGYKGCADPAIIENINIIADPQPTSNLAATSIQAWDVAAATGWSNTTHSNIEGSSAEDAIIGSDVLTVQHASTESLTLVGNMSAENANIQTEVNTLGLEAGDAIFISDCESADIFRATSASNGSGRTTFAHSNSNNTTNNLSKAYGDDAEVMAFIDNTYFVADTGRNTIRGDDIFALFRKDGNDVVNEIVEGVENMQIQFGEELSTGNLRYIDGGSVVDPSIVTTVKITLLIASQNRVLEADDDFEYPMVSGVATREDHDDVGDITFPNDRRLRQTFSTTLKLRNRRVNE